jgi:hypothetical protein
MYTEKKEQNTLLSTPRIEMAYESINRPKRQIIDRPTTEEHESKKREFAEHFAKELIHAFSPEDRFDVFNEVRSQLEIELKQQAEELSYKIEGDSKYLELLKNLIY